MLSAAYEPLFHSDSSFPVIFHFDSLSRMNNVVEAHWHEGIEILYCIRGSATIIADGEPQTMTKGNFCIINSGALHYITQNPEEHCCYYCLIVEPALFEGSSLPFGEIILERTIDDARIFHLYQLLIEEMQKRKPYYKEAVKGYIRLLFAELYRSHARPESEVLAGHRPDMVKKAILYLRANFRNKITVDDVCAYVGFSKYYLCHTFRESSGRSIMDYVNYLRCSHARRLLENGDCNITESAAQSGFSDVSYFTKMFKKQMGFLPSEIKKNIHSSRSEKS